MITDNYNWSVCRTMPAGSRTKSGIKQISIHFLLWHLIDNLTSDTGASDSIVCWDSSRCINSLSLALGALPPGTELESSMEAYSYWHALKHKYTAFHKNPLKKDNIENFISHLSRNHHYYWETGRKHPLLYQSGNFLTLSYSKIHVTSLRCSSFCQETKHADVGD